jgi:hypothetical protein
MVTRSQSKIVNSKKRAGADSSLERAIRHYLRQSVRTPHFSSSNLNLSRSFNFLSKTNSVVTLAKKKPKKKKKSHYKSREHVETINMLDRVFSPDHHSDPFFKKSCHISMNINNLMTTACDSDYVSTPCFLTMLRPSISNL